MASGLSLFLNRIAMKTKHTPIPWEVRIHDKGPYFSEVEIWHENYGLLARMPDNSSIWYSDKNEEVAQEALDRNIANATIMAATLELLEALIEISEGKGRYDLDPIQHAANCIEDMKALALEAIKKATP